MLPRCFSLRPQHFYSAQKVSSSSMGRTQSDVGRRHRLDEVYSTSMRPILVLLSYGLTVAVTCSCGGRYSSREEAGEGEPDAAETTASGDSATASEEEGSGGGSVDGDDADETTTGDPESCPSECPLTKTCIQGQCVCVGLSPCGDDCCPTDTACVNDQCVPVCPLGNDPPCL